MSSSNRTGRKGVLLSNIGTPRSFSPEDVGKYLNQFLMDPNVIRAPTPIRALLVKGIIVPFRSKKSAALYKKIWTPEGSPLLVYSKRFAEKLQSVLGNNWFVRVGMRYGEPSFESALKSMPLDELDELILFPLYPQYALSSTQSSIDHFQAALASLQQGGKISSLLPVRTIQPFYNNIQVVEAWAQLFRAKAPKEFDHVVMSFHGLPKAHLTTLSQSCSGCPKTSACPTTDQHRKLTPLCYRRQSFETAALIAKSLKLSPDHYSVGFQSRLGPAEWIGPDTLSVVKDLAARGKKRIVVLCPSFVADCLETLEEVQLGMKETFIEAGGEEFHALPCLNADDFWVAAAKEILCQNPT